MAEPSDRTVGSFIGMAGGFFHAAEASSYTNKPSNRTNKSSSYANKPSNRTDKSSSYTGKPSSYTYKSFNRTDKSSSYTNKSPNRTDKSSSYTNKSFIGAGKPSIRTVFPPKHAKSGKNRLLSPSSRTRWSKRDSLGYAANRTKSTNHPKIAINQRSGSAVRPGGGLWRRLAASRNTRRDAGRTRRRGRLRYVCGGAVQGAQRESRFGEFSPRPSSCLAKKRRSGGSWECPPRPVHSGMNSGRNCPPSRCRMATLRSVPNLGLPA